MNRLVFTAMTVAWLNPTTLVAQESKDRPPIDKEVAEAIKILEDPDKSLQTKEMVVSRLGSSGAKAAPAIPALKAYMATQKDKNSKYRVLQVYARIGKPAVPELIELMADREIGTWAIDMIMSSIKTDAKDAAPAIRKAVQAPFNPTIPNTGAGSPAYWAAAVEAMAAIGIDPKESMPLYTKIILMVPPTGAGFGRTDGGQREAVHRAIKESLTQLSKLGPKAKEGLPALLQLLKNFQNPKLRPLYEYETESRCIHAIGSLGKDAESALPTLRAHRTIRNDRSLDRAIEEAIDRIKGN